MARQTELDRLAKRIRTSEHPNTAHGACLENITTQKQLEEMFQNLAENDTRLRDIFKLIQFYDQGLESAASAKKPEVLVSAVSTQITNWENYKATVTKPDNLSSGKFKALKRAIAWWKRTLKSRRFKFFSLKELDRAISGLNGSSTGLDRISVKLFPTSQSGKLGFLRVINKELFSSRKFDSRLMIGSMTFLLKADSHVTGKLRPITVGSRFGALLDRLVASRCDGLINEFSEYDDRFGFLRNRNIEKLTGELAKTYLQAKNEGSKISLLFTDQSSAYDLLSHSKTLLKIFKLIKRSTNNNDGYYNICFGYCYRWLTGRRVRFRGQIIVLLTGAPQGSPLSCLVYVISFDFETEKSSGWYFADDLILMFIAKNWEMNENLVKKELRRLGNWAEENGAKLNLKKTKLVFLHRKTETTTKFSCTISTEAKTLGIHFDNNLNFAAHTSRTVSFLKIKGYILSQLRTKLNLSFRCLTNIMKCYRNIVFSSGFFVLLLSSHQFKRLSISLDKMTKSCFGSSRLVPSSVLHEVCGSPSAEKLVTYWSALRRYEYKFTKYQHVFDLALHERAKASQVGVPRVLRPSTIQSRNNSVAKRTRWPEKVFEWIEKSEYATKILKNMPKNVICYKTYLKKNIFDIDLYKIHQDKTIKKIIRNLNEKYYAKFGNV